MMSIMKMAIACLQTLLDSAHTARRVLVIADLEAVALLVALAVLQSDCRRVEQTP